jgi:hypothetical protein
MYSEFMKIDSQNYVLPIKESSESISDDREFNQIHEAVSVDDDDIIIQEKEYIDLLKIKYAHDKQLLNKYINNKKSLRDHELVD